MEGAASVNPVDFVAMAPRPQANAAIAGAPAQLWADQAPVSGLNPDDTPPPAYEVDAPPAYGEVAMNNHSYVKREIFVVMQFCKCHIVAKFWKSPAIAAAAGMSDMKWQFSKSDDPQRGHELKPTGKRFRTLTSRLVDLRVLSAFSTLTLIIIHY